MHLKKTHYFNVEKKNGPDKFIEIQKVEECIQTYSDGRLYEIIYLIVNEGKSTSYKQISVIEFEKLEAENLFEYLPF